MKRHIVVTKGIGKANTELSAFDKALIDAGIADHNLIHLSSIIPPKSEIRKEKYELKAEEFGNKLYVVIAEMRESRVSKKACAGLGWVLSEDGSQKGLFVEHEGESEEEVQGLIEKSLSEMKKNRADNFGPVQSEIASILCESSPVCAVVAAVYKSEAW